MGARWPLELVNARGERWVGDHRPRWADLRRVLSAMSELPLSGPLGEEALRASLGDLVDALEAVPPSRFVLRLKNAAIPDVVLDVCPARVPEGRLALGGSRARRRFELAQRLRAVGVETPRPLGYLERAKRPASAPSLFVRERVPAATLAEVRDRRLDPSATMMRFGEKRALVRAVGELLRRLHATEVHAGPVRPEEILVAREGVMVADLEPTPRARGRSRPAVEALATLDAAFPTLSRTDRLRFLDTYLRTHAGRATLRRELFTTVATHRPARQS